MSIIRLTKAGRSREKSRQSSRAAASLSKMASISERPVMANFSNAEPALTFSEQRRALRRTMYQRTSVSQPVLLYQRVPVVPVCTSQIVHKVHHTNADQRS